MLPELALLFVMPNIGITELMVILGIAVLIFGGRRLGDVGKGLGQGIRNFKEAVKDDKSESENVEKT